MIAVVVLASMPTKDVRAAHLLRGAREQTPTRLGKLWSWTTIAILVWLVLWLRECAPLIALPERKRDLLIRPAPAFILGLDWQALRAGPVLAGLAVGVVGALRMAVGDFAFARQGKVHGSHPGLVAVPPNLAIAVPGSWAVARRPPGLPGNVAGR